MCTRGLLPYGPGGPPSMSVSVYLVRVYTAHIWGPPLRKSGFPRWRYIHVVLFLKCKGIIGWTISITPLEFNGEGHLHLPYIRNGQEVQVPEVGWGCHQIVCPRASTDLKLVLLNPISSYDFVL